MLRNQFMFEGEVFLLYFLSQSGRLLLAGEKAPHHELGGL